MITSILIEYGSFKDFKTIDTKDITDLSKVNVFIGPNNSGKSRLLRYLFKSEMIFRHSSDQDLYGNYINSINDAINYLKRFENKYIKEIKILEKYNSKFTEETNDRQFLDTIVDLFDRIKLHIATSHDYINNIRDQIIEKRNSLSSFYQNNKPNVIYTYFKRIKAFVKE